MSMCNPQADYLITNLVLKNTPICFSPLQIIS